MPHEHGENCKEVFALLSEYLDAELEPQTCEEIEMHLAGCAPCIEFLNSLKRSISLCHECPPAVTPPPMSAEQRDLLRAAYMKSVRKGG